MYYVLACAKYINVALTNQSFWWDPALSLRLRDANPTIQYSVGSTIQPLMWNSISMITLQCIEAFSPTDCAYCCYAKSYSVYSLCSILLCVNDRFSNNNIFWWLDMNMYISPICLCPDVITRSNHFLGAVSIRKTVLPGMAIPMLKIRRPNGRLIFNMEIAIRRSLYWDGALVIVYRMKLYGDEQLVIIIIIYHNCC